METSTKNIFAKKKRNYLPLSLKIKRWKNIQEFYEELKNRQLKTSFDLKKWMYDRSELESIVHEELAKRYIGMTCNTASKKISAAYTYFINKVKPQILSADNELNEKLLNTPLLKSLKATQYLIYIRNVKAEKEIYREKNIPIISEVQAEEKRFGEIIGAMSVNINGKKLTIQQAAKLLKEPDRKLREKVFKEIHKRKLKDSEQLHNLFTKLVRLRHKIAVNAGFDNFRDYQFKALCRFDYTIDDCFAFHQAIKNEFVPIVKLLRDKRKKQLGYADLKPWDLEVDVSGKPPLSPSSSASDLIAKTIKCFSGIDPFMGKCMNHLNKQRLLDLESRIGKAPGGYCYPLYETGAPFIFMNSTNSFKDLVTLVHEGGHAVHSFLTNNLELVQFQSTPSEVAELASMSMELLTHDRWGTYFNNKDDLLRAQNQHLENIIMLFPWIAAVDKFQHWIYTNPNHSIAERTKAWVGIHKEFSSETVNWSGFEKIFAHQWQSQIHIFDSPFYYIEYGMAQLGAIAIWKNYHKNPRKTIREYLCALSLGNTRTIPEVFKTAGIRFDFSAKYMNTLADFVKCKFC